MRGLPSAGQTPRPAAYTSAEVFAWERRHFFGGGWTCAGHASRLPATGDRLPAVLSAGVVEEIKLALAEEPDAVELVAAAIWAVGSYDPINEAVVVESVGDVIRVLVVRADDAEEMGGIEFSATPTH